MGLWTRVKRSMRALFGGIVEATEDPELILQQTIRDMRDRIPDLNNSVAQVMATEKLLGKNKERLETQVVDLDSKIKASVKMGRDDIATAYIGQLQQAQVDLQRTVHQYEHSQLASKQALKARDNYMLQMQRRTAEAMQLINQSKQAKLQEHQARGEVATGLLYLDPKSSDMHEMSATTDVPLSRVPFEKLCPGSAKLAALQEAFR